MRVVSLFCGAGGLDLGFIRAGHEIVLAIDNYVDAVETYRANVGRHVRCMDARELHAEDVPDCDVVIGGFPCQGFSVANTGRHEQDERNGLYKEMLRIILEKSPAFFVAENVKGILSLSQGRVLDMIMQDFEQTGYRTEYRVLNAADFGVPQKRQRVFFVGCRNDLAWQVQFPEPTHAEPGTLLSASMPGWVSVGEALSNLPDPDKRHNIANHTYSKYKLRFNGYLGHRRIDPDQPAPTVTARGDDRGGVVVLHHPSNARRMTARELATVQSFPTDFVFSGTQSSVYRQVANSVPPLLAEAVARSLPQHVRGTACSPTGKAI